MSTLACLQAKQKVSKEPTNLENRGTNLLSPSVKEKRTIADKFTIQKIVSPLPFQAKIYPSTTLQHLDYH